MNAIIITTVHQHANSYNKILEKYPDIDKLDVCINNDGMVLLKNVTLESIIKLSEVTEQEIIVIRNWITWESYNIRIPLVLEIYDSWRE